MHPHLEELKSEALAIAERATCPRAHCGIAAFSLDGEIICANNEHLGADDCIIEDGHCVSAIHAEVALIGKAARNGVRLLGSTVVSSQRPCNRCLLAMKAAGILNVFYINDYHSKVHGAEFCSPKLMSSMHVQQLK